MAKETNHDWPVGFDAHRRAQIIRQARESTPIDRLRFVEEALILCQKAGIDYHQQKRIADVNGKP